MLKGYTKQEISWMMYDWAMENLLFVRFIEIPSQIQKDHEAFRPYRAKRPSWSIFLSGLKYFQTAFRRAVF